MADFDEPIPITTPSGENNRVAPVVNHPELPGLKPGKSNESSPDAPSRPHDSSLAPITSVEAPQQRLAQQKEIALKNGASIETSQTTADGKQLKGFDQYDRVTKQREFLADNGNGTYTRYSYKDDNTLLGANGERINLKSKARQDDDKNNANEQANLHAAATARSGESAGTSAKRMDTEPRFKEPSFTSTAQIADQTRAIEAIKTGAEPAPITDLKLILAQSAKSQSKLQDLSADGVLGVRFAKPAVNCAHSAAPGSTFRRQSIVRYASNGAPGLLTGILPGPSMARSS